jgi:hypothetical protein
MIQKFKYLGAVIDDENNITHTIQERICGILPQCSQSRQYLLHYSSQPGLLYTHTGTTKSVLTVEIPVPIG